jgi:hypothetical protein
MRGHRSCGVIVHGRYCLHLYVSSAYRPGCRSANIIAAEARSAIERKLADLEAKSGIQLVGHRDRRPEIEPYANELFRN